MNYDFSEEQIMLREALARLLSQRFGFEERQRILRGESAETLWPAIVEMGLVALPFSERMGGLGGTAMDVVAVAELFGRHLVVEPYFSTVSSAGAMLARLEGADFARDYLTSLVQGELKAALAHEEAGHFTTIETLRTEISEDGGGHSLSGRKLLVIDGDLADVLLVTGRDADGRACVVGVDRRAPGVGVRSYRTIDVRAAADIEFDSVRVEPGHTVVGAEASISAAIDDAILALSAEAVGAMAVLLETTAEFAGTRKQFGTPIAGFQVIAHRLADMKIAYTKARATLLLTAALAADGRAQPRDFSILKAQAGRLGRAIAESAVQIHGGIGMTDELPVGHYLKRIAAVEMMFGSTDFHLRQVGRSLTLA